jgi:parallel beta-helix repeat protein
VCEQDTGDHCEYTSIQDAVDDADPGDTVRVTPGTYEEAVEVNIEDLTIDGAGQGATVLDGDGIQKNGIDIGADGVTVQDLTVKNFGGNGVKYTGVVGFYVYDVSAIDNGPYGIYAIRSEVGEVADSYASGHGDSGFYIGEVASCECVLTDLVAEENLIGYSGTGAGHVTIKDSVWRNNAAGIVPNVLPQEPQPQTRLVVVNNEIVDNNNQQLSERYQFSGGVYVPHGLGVVIAGGADNLVTENTITGHERAGLAMVFLFTEPSLNRIVDNTFDNGAPGNSAGPADLFHTEAVDVLWDGGGVDNCFADNSRTDGADITYDAGAVWNAAGLPGCDTPSAGAPAPNAMARELSLLLYGCEVADHVENPDHCELRAA